MKAIIKLILVLAAGMQASFAQQIPVLTLDSIIERIATANPTLQSYAARADAYEQNAIGAKAWMAPMAGAGTFMTPYPGQRVMGQDKGMLMLQFEQEFPNRSKLRAREKLFRSRSQITGAEVEITLNDYRAKARELYFEWVYAEKIIASLKRNEEILKMMKKVEELRYPYNQSQLTTVYQTEAEIQKNQGRIYDQELQIDKSKAALNGLMQRSFSEPLMVDTSLEMLFQPSLSTDSNELILARKDLLLIDREIQFIHAGIDLTSLERKPAFSLRFDHMSPLAAMMPQAFSIMAMMTIPIAPWSSGYYKAEIRAARSNIRALELERNAFLSETAAKINGLQNEILVMKKKLITLKSKLVPALQKAFELNMLHYQENKLPLIDLLSSFEALRIAQTDLYEQELLMVKKVIEYEKELFK